jgi:dihydrofolate synthase / folylpolyglutamate synthase
MNIWRVPYPKFGDGPGLERVCAVAARLGVDLARFGEHGAVIVGSNGKGSTAAMTAALLGQASENVGLFTSPHLFALNERFRIGDDDISDEDLSHHWSRVIDAVAASGLSEKFGGFEFLFLIAADWFATRGCRHTVCEAGIGGRLDPVRLIEAKRLALTSLDLEHTELLGATLEEIARDKLGAAPAGATVFVSESCSPVRGAIEAHAALHGVRVGFVGAEELGELSAPLSGNYQRENAALALKLVRDIAPISETRAALGLAATRWPGRLEIIGDEPFTVIDVGHTPAGVRAALDGFQQLRGDRTGVLVCGASLDKDAATLIGAIAPGFSTIICAAARHKGAPAAIIAAHAAAANPTAEIAIADCVADAHRLAETRAKAVGAAIFVGGGLFLAAEYKAVHMGRDPASLAFF